MPFGGRVDCPTNILYCEWEGPLSFRFIFVYILGPPGAEVRGFIACILCHGFIKCCFFREKFCRFGVYGFNPFNGLPWLRRV